MVSRISCDAHDYFEIVCMRRSLIMVTTYNNEIFKGIALNIIVQDNKEILEMSYKDSIHFVALTDIKELQAKGNHKRHNFVVKWPSSKGIERKGSDFG